MIRKLLLTVLLILLCSRAYADVELNGTTAAKYSETATSNTAASPNGWPNGTFPNQVEPINRVTLGALQRFWNRINGQLTVGGTANAITLTPANTSFPTAYVTGEQFEFKATAANTGPTQVNINGIGLTNLFKKGSAGVVALTGGEIQNNDLVTIAYDGTEFQIISSNASSISSVASLTVTGSTPPTNGIYLPATNAPGISANSFAVAEFMNSGTAVNYWTLTNAATTGIPVIGVAGSDTNITAGLNSKGTGGIYFATNGGGNAEFRIVDTPSSIDWIQETGSASGNPATVSFSAQGSDSNININLVPKGTGNVQVNGTNIGNPGSSIGTSGYQKFVSGLIEEWVPLSGATNPQTVSLPLTFPTGVMGCTCTMNTGAHSGAWNVATCVATTSQIEVWWGGGSDATFCTIKGN